MACEPASKRRKIDDAPPTSVEHSVAQYSDSQDSSMVPPSSCSPLELLPTELLHILFTYLSTCDRMTLRVVCRRFRATLDNPIYWRYVNIPPTVNSKDPERVKCILKVAKPHAEVVSIVGYSPKHGSVSFLKSCSSITTLDLFGARITHTAMNLLLTSLPNLSRLCIAIQLLRSVVSTGSLPTLEQLVVNIFGSQPEPEIFFSKWFEQTLSKCTNIAANMDLYLTNPLLKTDGTVSYNFSCYAIYACMFKMSPIPSVNSSPNSTTSYRVPGIVSGPVVIVSNAVSSSVLSNYILYTLGYIDSSLYSNTALNALKPLTEDVGITVTALKLVHGCEIQSFDVLKFIVQCTPNLLVIDVNNVKFTDAADSLDVLYKALSLYCPKLTSISTVTESCMIENASEVWKDMLSFKQLRHLSICSCFFQLLQSTDNIDFHKLQINSLILYVHSTQRSPVVWLNLIVSKIACIHTLEVLHFHIDYDRSRHVLNLKVLLDDGCQRLVELCIFKYLHLTGRPVMRRTRRQRISLDTRLSSEWPIEFSPSIGRLQYLMLENVHIDRDFFYALVPRGKTNHNLKVLSIEVYKAYTEEIERVMKNCPSLVSCIWEFTTSFDMPFVNHRKNAVKAAKENQLLTFDCKSSGIGRCESIFNTIYFSRIKYM